MANRDKISDLMKRAAPYLTRMSDDVNADTTDKEIDALIMALETHKASADHDGIAHIWTALNKFLQPIEVKSVIPSNSDSSDIGSSARLFRKGFFSELSTLVFKKENVLVMDGTLVLTKQSGKFEADVSDSATAIDFGQTMTPGDFLLLQAENKMEFMQVGSLVSGTTYNVTRNLDGSGADAWNAGSVYFVRGHVGDGWLELTAGGEQRFSVFLQGAEWNQSTEVIRIGELNGWQSSPITGYGIVIGDYTANEFLVYSDVDKKLKLTGEVKAESGTLGNLDLLGNLTVDSGSIIAGDRSVIIDDIGISIINPAPGVANQPFRFMDANNDQYFSISGASVMGNTEGEILLENPPQESNNSYTRLSLIARNTLGTVSHCKLVLQAHNDGNKIISTAADFIAGKITATKDLIVDGTIKDSNDVAYLKSNETAANADKLDGLDSSAFGRPVFLTTPLTSTSWDGDNKTTSDRAIVDLSTVFGVPAGVKAVLMSIQTKADAANDYIRFGPNSTYNHALTCRTAVAGQIAHASGIVPCDANGDIYCYPSGTVEGVYVWIWGYWL